jgi:hypothetical protein
VWFAAGLGLLAGVISMLVLSFIVPRPEALTQQKWPAWFEIVRQVVQPNPEALVLLMDWTESLIPSLVEGRRVHDVCTGRSKKI